jgi:transposase InsO family protein
MSVAEQRYRAVLAVISDGRTVKEVAAGVGVARQTLHAWLGKYEAGGLEGLADRSHRPRGCPHQMPPEVEAAVLEARRNHPSWGPRRIAFELTRRSPTLRVTESAVYRCLRRAGLVEPDGRRRRRREWKRWERGEPNELWQMDTVGGFLLADGSQAKALTGVDDHSRFCVSAKLITRERTRLVCDGLTAALTTYGVPEQILTDNGKVFTGKYNHPPTEVLFDRICRENGIDHLLTQPRSPTTTGKIERFHRTLRAEFDTRRTFSSLRAAQGALDEWVGYYNTARPHQALEDATPAERFGQPDRGADTVDSSAGLDARAGGGRGGGAGRREPVPPASSGRDGDGWVSRKVGRNGIVCVGWQQVSVGKHRAGARCDVLVSDQLLQFWIGSELMKTVTRTSSGEVRKKHAQGSRGQG